MDIALLVLRVVIGLLFVGHGAQKLFGWFGGHGLAGTAGWLGSMNLKPAPLWAFAAGASEFFGGLFLTLGLLTPIGGIAVIAAMLVATLLVHLQNGLWNTNGGYELPLVFSAGALTLILAGPGAYSLDALLGIAVPGSITLVAALAALGSAIYLVASRRAATQTATATNEA
ncbi:MAG TPA: DoxX family protein [Trueperaceae bacterium]